MNSPALKKQLRLIWRLQNQPWIRSSAIHMLQHAIITLSVIVGLVAETCRGDSLDNWVLRYSTSGIVSVTYGNGVFVAVGGAGNILTSTDGISWIPQTSGTTNILKKIIYANGLFVAVGGRLYPIPDPIVNTSTILTSSNGYDWTVALNTISPASNQTAFLTCVSYGNGLFVAGGIRNIYLPPSPPPFGFRPAVLTSPDGITWTQRDTGQSGNWISSITYGNGKFVAGNGSFTGTVGGGTLSFLTSPDGITWQKDIVPIATSASVREITYDNGLFVAVGGSIDYPDSSCRILTSPNGDNWNLVDPVRLGDLRGITYGNGVFVTVGGPNIMTSQDGINWVPRNAGSIYLNSVCYGNNTFVAEGDNQIFSSGPGSRTNLVLITHGYNPTTTTDNDWINSMADNIARQIYQQHGGGSIGNSPVLRAPDGTVIQRLTWDEGDSQREFGISEDGESVSWDVVSFFWPVNAHAVGPNDAGANGMILGHQLGKQIHDAGYKFVHLIGHSAGSWLIDSLADTLKELDAQSGTTTTVHCTFLDAYAPPTILTDLGNTADFAEQYVNKEDWPFTDGKLCNAFNMSVTDLVDPDNDKTHSWPWKWYQKTTVNPASGQLGWGFQRTLEYSGTLPNHAVFGRSVLLNLQTGVSEGLSWSDGCLWVNLFGYSFSPSTSTMSEPSAVQFPNSQSVSLNTITSAWIRASVVVTGVVNTLEFDFQYPTNSTGGGLISALLDGHSVWVMSQNAALAGVNHSGAVWLGQNINEGMHTLEFRITSTNGQNSAVTFQNARFSLAVGAEPTLYFNRSTNGLTLSWPSVFTNAVLESTIDLGSSSNWSPEPRTPIVSGDMLKVTITNSEMSALPNSKFFRLRKP